MARIRTIKPSFFTDLVIAKLALTARLTYVGLWTYVDDEGRGVDDARLVKAAIWPLDDNHTVRKVEADLAAIAKAGRICRYEVDGRRYLHVCRLKENQVINRPKHSDLPPPPHGEGSPDDPPPHGAISDRSVIRHGNVTAGSLLEVEVEGKGRDSDYVGGDAPSPTTSLRLVDARPQDPMPVAGRWRMALADALDRRDVTGTWDLVDAYCAAWDGASDGLAPEVAMPGLIALTCDFVERIDGKPLEPAERTMVAKVVRRHGKAVLLGYDEATVRTQTDAPKDRLAYALATIRRFIGELGASA